jgi:hypothetical protein
MERGTVKGKYVFGTVKGKHMFLPLDSIAEHLAVERRAEGQTCIPHYKKDHFLNCLA